MRPPRLIFPRGPCQARVENPLVWPGGCPWPAAEKGPAWGFQNQPQWLGRSGRLCSLHLAPLRDPCKLAALHLGGGGSACSQGAGTCFYAGHLGQQGCLWAGPTRAITPTPVYFWVCSQVSTLFLNSFRRSASVLPNRMGLGPLGTFGNV